MDVKHKRPSPALIVAFAALFVALTGTAFAAVAANSILSKHIKDGEVRRPDIRNGAVNSAKVADASIGVVDLAPAARPAPQPMWAVVQTDGSLARGSAGVTSVYSGASFYTVTFPRDVTACAYSATLGHWSTETPAGGEISVYSSLLGPKSVTAVARDSAGGFSDRPFHLVVVC